jgi:hypothetical protein
MKLFVFTLLSSLFFIASCQRLDPIVVLNSAGSGLSEQENYQIFLSIKEELSKKGNKILSEGEFLKNKSSQSACGENECLEDLSKKWGISRIVKISSEKSSSVSKTEQWRLRLTWLDLRKKAIHEELELEANNLDELCAKLSTWAKSVSL